MGGSRSEMLLVAGTSRLAKEDEELGPPGLDLSKQDLADRHAHQPGQLAVGLRDIL